LIEAVKRGAMLSGGLPMVFPTISIHESFASPTSMFLRNLMAMDTEEMIRAQPMDAVVLIGGCDKTVPAQLMAAVSADVPAIQLITGPMLVGYHRGEMLGACTDCRRLWGEHRAGAMDQDEVEVVSGRLAPTLGTCMVMGTASTMACIAEAIGLALPGTGSIPATHADRIRAAESTGRQAVALAQAGPRPSEILTEAAFHNAMVVLQAIGGSTNGLVHLAAIARRRGMRIDLQEFDRIGREVPVLIDLKPSGAHYMEHFHWAGGMPRLLKELRANLVLDAMTVTGGTIGAVADAAEDIPGQQVIRERAHPVKASGGMAILSGNLAPGGSVIKHSAATAALLEHTGRAVVFDSVEDLTRRIDDPDLDVEPHDILVLRNAGPKGAPGMPEAGYLPIPRKLARAGIKDMVRISDARMSGTAFGTIVLHITPEAAIGGPLGLVQTGDRIRLDVPARRLDLLVAEDELQRRAAEWRPPAHLSEEQRGYRALYLRSVLQADEGCDFDFC
jgi:dihydroxy-acid dehydratase